MRAQFLRLIAVMIFCLAVSMLVSGCTGTLVETPVKQGAKAFAKAAEKRTVAEVAEKATKKAAEKGARERVTREAAGVTAREEAARLAAGQPLGRGHTGRWEPHNLREKLAMDQVKANPAAGLILADKVGDSHWEQDGWVKMAQNVEGIEIHYVFNTRSGAFDDAKYK